VQVVIWIDHFDLDLPIISSLVRNSCCMLRVGGITTIKVTYYDVLDPTGNLAYPRH
jgi:hypothetical protein